MKHNLGIIKLVTLACVLIFVGACADGDLNLEQPEPPLPQLAEIGSFQICKVGMPETCADSLTVENGQPVELIWETTNATSVEIASADGSFLASPLEASGSVVVEAVAASMRFTLSAMTADGVAQKDVAVEVADAKPEISAALTISDDSIIEGGSVELCWTVTPPDASITVVGDDNVTYFPAEGDSSTATCKTVTPAKSTVYTLTATSADGGESKTATASVEVNKQLAVEISASAVDAENNVTLNWEITGSEPDSVSISGVGDVKPVTADGKGSKIVPVVADTTFTITVKAGDQTATDSVSVSLPAREVELEIMINDVPVAEETPEQPAAASAEGGLTPKAAVAEGPDTRTVNAGTFFESEEVKLSWNANVNGAADRITSVRLLDSAGTVIREDLSAEDEVLLPVSGDGQYILSISGNGIKEAKANIAVNVRNWLTATNADPITGRDITAVTAYKDDVNRVIAGVGGDMIDGNVKLVRATAGTDLASEMLDIGFKSLYENSGSEAGKIPTLLGKFHTYPINTIAMDTVDDQTRLFVGTAGGVVFSKDDAQSWEILMKGTLRQNSSYTGSHTSCKGRIQDGKTDGEIASMEQICDIIIDDDGRFIVATDHKVVYLKYGVDEYLKAKAEMAVLCPPGEISDDECSTILIEKGLMDKFPGGMPVKGQPGNAVYGVANFDIELANFDGQKVLLSATNRGIFMSMDRGVTWSKMTTESKVLDDVPVYSVAVDRASGLIFAGTNDAIYYKAFMSGDWTKAGDAAAPQPEPQPAAEEAAEGGNSDGIVTVGQTGNVPATDASEVARVFSITVDPIQARSIYAATGSGVLVSRDGGKTFRNVKSSRILSITAKADATGMVGIYAASAGGMSVSLARPNGIIVPEQPAEEPAGGEQTPAQEGGNVPTVGGEQSTVEGGATGVNGQLL